MTTVTVTIIDDGDEVRMEGKLDDVSALDAPPTPALIIGSYLAANAELICKDAIKWMHTMAGMPETPQ